MAVISYKEVLHEIKDERTVHLLLGNGFSIGCDPVFKYQSLYEIAVKKGLSENAQAVFKTLGTNNFEGVMRVLDDSDWVARQYGLIQGGPSALIRDLEIVKTALVEAIADSHLEHSGKVSEKKKAAATKFFSRFHNVFTTNYDLVAYWVVMSGGNKPRYWDGYGEDKNEPDAPYVLFSFQLGSHSGIFYLHGALHLYVKDGEVCKHCWSRTGQPLTGLIRAGLEDGQYPLFVAEGTSEKKLRQIHSNAYLAYALSKLGRVEGTLIVLGHSLSEQDRHLRDTIAGNKKIKRLFISVRDAKNTGKADAAVTSMQLTRQERGLDEFEVAYFSADSADVWK